MSIFAVAPPGFEDLVVAELKGLDAEGVRPVTGGVEFRGGWSAVYRANLFLRVATRVLVRVMRFEARTFGRFRRGLERIDWLRWLPADCTVDLRISARRSRLYHTGRLAEECAAVLREQAGVRPTAAGEADFRLQIRLVRDGVTVSLDTSGEALYRRGYRSHVGAAPLRENLAAALLLRAGWNAAEPLLDPFCGSGVFLVEAARSARGLAPGNLRDFPFRRLPGFDPAAWKAVIQENRLGEHGTVHPAIFGADRDSESLRLTARAARRGGVADQVQIAHAPAEELEPPAPSGLVITNPPYGRRLGGAPSAYRSLGRLLRGPFAAWRWAVIVPDRRAEEALGQEPADRREFRSGGLQLRLMIGQAGRS